ncbi:MAG: hypothetical protein GY922_01040 [Proteobacteria bacterium]|jgi:hypothetical protein|nr:hypothetical protein [Pseudomonadota bacterium]
MIGFCAWVGAACMVAAPFIIDTDAGKLLAIAGLALLTVQAVATKSYNLIMLNVLGIGGYLYALYF